MLKALPLPMSHDARCSLALGLALRREGNRERALQSILLAADAQPKDAALRVDIGTALEDLGSTEAAERSYRAAIEIDPKSELAYQRLGALLNRTGRAKSAAEVLRRGLRKIPGSVDLALLLANALDSSGNSDHALVMLRELVERVPDHPEARRTLARLLDRRGDRGALQAWKAVARIATKDREALQAIAAIHAKEGRHEEELAVRRELAAGSPVESNSAFAGDLSAFGVVELLEFLRLQRASGTLSLRCERGDAQLRVRNGFIIDAVSPAMQRLDVRLMDSARIFKSMPDGSLAASAFDPDLLGELISSQLMQALRETAEWSSGQFRFQRETPQNGAEPLVQLDIQAALMELMRQVDEARPRKKNKAKSSKNRPDVVLTEDDPFGLIEFEQLQPPVHSGSHSQSGSH